MSEVVAPPQVSIVIPAYNAAATIAASIDSAVSQGSSSLPVEVLVVDDGSTDRTATWVGAFAATHPMVRLVSQSNAGACAARNRGLSEARGRWVQFLDADDVLLPGKLARQLPEAEATPEVLTFTAAERVDEDGAREPLPLDRCCDDAVVFMLTGPLPTMSPLHRTEFLRAAGGWRIDLPCSQERELHLRLAAGTATTPPLPFRRLDFVGYRIHRQPASLSADPLRVLRQHVRYLPPLLADLEARGELGEPRRRAAAHLLAAEARQLLRAGDETTAAAAFAAAAAVHPRGGLHDAYGTGTRLLRRLVGPQAVESLVAWRRRPGRRPSTEPAT